MMEAMERGREDPESVLQQSPLRPEALVRQLAAALEGAIWPLSREALVAVALENEAGRSVLTLLGGLPAGPFRSDVEIAQWLAERAFNPGG
jgi:hypothetical protein